MTTWQPPIPSGALYSPHAIALGPGLALLAWCYDQVERDGSIQISLEKAAADIGKPYGTIRDWWKALRGSEGKSPFFSEITPCGRKGWRVVFRTRWLDWRIMRHNYPEQRLQETLVEGERLLAVSGEQVAQINGLTVVDLGDYRFGFPVRVTACTYAGEEGLLNIEREVEMSRRQVRALNEEMMSVQIGRAHV